MQEREGELRHCIMVWAQSGCLAQSACSSALIDFQYVFGIHLQHMLPEAWKLFQKWLHQAKRFSVMKSVYSLQFTVYLNRQEFTAPINYVHSENALMNFSEFVYKMKTSILIVVT